MSKAIRVILAEDHTLVREGTRRILEQHRDLQVVGEAADGNEAVALVERLRPDVAVVDIAMPRLNGIEATRRIKAISPATSVLILSAYDDDQYVSALLEAGAAGYVLKDLPGHELVEAVRSVHAGEAVLHPVIARKVLRHFTAGAEGGDRQSTTQLSPREQEVLKLAAQGRANKDIARHLTLSERTVQVHLSHIFDKLGVASRTEAVIRGLREGWLKLEDLP